jgi:hypothetical protein
VKRYANVCARHPATTACTRSSWMCRTVASAMGYRCG